MGKEFIDVDKEGDKALKNPKYIQRVIESGEECDSPVLFEISLVNKRVCPRPVKKKHQIGSLVNNRVKGMQRPDKG